MTKRTYGWTAPHLTVHFPQVSDPVSVTELLWSRVHMHARRLIHNPGVGSTCLFINQHNSSSIIWNEDLSPLTRLAILC